MTLFCTFLTSLPCDILLFATAVFRLIGFELRNELEIKCILKPNISLSDRRLVVERRIKVTILFSLEVHHLGFYFLITSFSDNPNLSSKKF